MKTNERNRFVPCRNLSPNYLNKKRGMIHVFSFLLMMLFVVTGCSNDEEFITGDELLRANNITDVTHLFFQEKQEDGRTFYYGIRKGKDWFAFFDNAEVLQREWYGKDNSYDPSASGSVLLKEFDNEELIFVFANKLFRLMNNQNVEYGAIFDNTYRVQSILTGNLYLIYSIIENADNNGVPVGNIYDFNGNIIVNDVCSTSITSVINFEPLPYVLNIGFKDNKVWIGYEDKNKDWQEVIGVETFERNRSIHLGYDEYENIYVEKIGVRNFIMTEWGVAFIPSYNIVNFFVDDLTYSNLQADIVFLCNGDKLINFSCEAPEQLHSWHNETLLINNKIVVSSEGELIADFVKPVENLDEAISLTEGIRYRNWRLYCIDYKEGVERWSADVPQLDNVLSDAKVIMTILEKSDSIWKYNCKVVNRDGSQYSFDFNLNIETGEIN